MTRKSKRELENAVEDLAPSPQESPTLPEVYDYFDHVAERPEDAPLPRERFAEGVVEGWPEATLPFDEEDLPPLTPRPSRPWSGSGWRSSTRT